MPLDSRTVDAIFTRLLLAYAGRWLSHIEGLPIDKLKAEWAEVLDGIPRWQVTHALEVLDDGPNPPTSRMFRQWCLRSPEVARPKPPVIEDKRQRDPARLAAELAKLHEKLRNRKPTDVWDELRRRHKAGESLTPTQLQMMRDALTERAPTGDAVTMKMTPVPRDLWPPGMAADIPETKRPKKAFNP